MKTPNPETGFISQTGLCKINNIHFTKDRFGSNSAMHKMIGQNMRYRTEQKDPRNKGMRVCYRIDEWLWDGRDISMLDKNGNEIKIEEVKLPEPKQFNPDFLDI